VGCLTIGDALDRRAPAAARRLLVVSGRRPRVLVTDGEQRAALAACRALEQGGYDVGVAAATRTAVSLWSRSCSRRIRVPEPRDDGAAYVEALAEVLERDEYDVLLPGSEASLLPISEQRQLVEPSVTLGLPPHEVLLRALDKQALQRVAAEVGVPPPRGIACSTASEARSAAVELGLPVAVKPSRSFLRAGDALRQESIRIVADLAAVEAAVAAVELPCTVQEFLRGARVVSCGGVRADGRLVAAGFCRYSRTWPPPAGNASLAVTIAPPDDLVDRVEQLVARTGWEGIFEVELLETPDGRFRAIDLNPRVFGQMSLIIQAGLNLPALWCDHALGRPAREPGRVRPRVTYRWEDAEVRHFYWQLRRRHVGAALAVLRPHRRVVHAHFRLADPGPFFGRVLYLASEAANRFFSRRPPLRSGAECRKEYDVPDRLGAGQDHR
jgi:predicted ATP-grasp superfamily ATP-dependent carboligase